MSGKFMTIKRIAISALTVMMIASQLTGCASVTQQEAVDMTTQNSQIEIEVAIPNDTNKNESNIEIGEDISYNWEALGYMNNYPEFRDRFDSRRQQINQYKGLKFIKWTYSKMGKSIFIAYLSNIDK